jgi:hypothetical protein
MRAHGCEANALQRSLPDETPSSRAGFGREFDEPIALPNTGAIHYLDSAAKCVFELIQAVSHRADARTDPRTRLTL